MPKHSHSGWSGVPWHHCDCHQKPYPVSQLRRQDGLIVCQAGFDNPQRTRAIDARPTQITRRLSDPADEPELAEILKQTQDNTSEYA